MRTSIKLEADIEAGDKMDQWIMVLAEEVETEGRQNDDIPCQECVLNIFGLSCGEHEDLVDFFDNNPTCSYEDTQDGRFVLRVQGNSQEAVIRQLTSRGYSLLGEAVERPLPPHASNKAWVYHLARGEVKLERNEDITSRVQEATKELVEEEEDCNTEKSDTESENDCHMKECKVTKKDDSVSLIQVVVKKGLK